MSKQYWMSTRPKRKLIIVPELLKVFAATAVGKPWEGNRELQLEFERQLVKFQWKAQNLSLDGSGSRTYAVLLYSFGLWYEDDEGVKLTNAGQELVEDNPPVPILTKQVLNFQFPSAYSQKRNVGIDQSFRLQPHSFLIDLLLEGSLAELSQDEIAFCIVPFAKNSGDIQSCIKRISDFRANPEEIKTEAIKSSGIEEESLKNIANTFINQLEYTGFFKERDENNFPLRLAADGADKARKAMKDYRRTLSDVPDAATFQRRYGSGLQKAKDYSATTPIPPTIDPTERVALLAYYEISLERPIAGITQELIEEISRSKGIPVRTVEKVLSKLADQPTLDRFEETYIQLSKGGTETATDFEIKTNGILSDDGFGFASVWVGPKPRHPDVFVYFDKVNKRHGILDMKAYREYALPLDHKNLMAHTYIPSFKNLEYEGATYEMFFFGYIAGGYGTGMSRSFTELLSMAGENGSYITSYNFLQLLRLHREKPFSPDEFGEIFASNKEIEYDEVKLTRS